MTVRALEIQQRSSVPDEPFLIRFARKPDPPKPNPPKPEPQPKPGTGMTFIQRETTDYQ